MTFFQIDCKNYTLYTLIGLRSFENEFWIIFLIYFENSGDLFAAHRTSTTHPYYIHMEHHHYCNIETQFYYIILNVRCKIRQTIYRPFACNRQQAGTRSHSSIELIRSSYWTCKNITRYFILSRITISPRHPLDLAASQCLRRRGTIHILYTRRVPPSIIYYYVYGIGIVSTHTYNILYIMRSVHSTDVSVTRSVATVKQLDIFMCVCCSSVYSRIHNIIQPTVYRVIQVSRKIRIYRNRFGRGLRHLEMYVQ